MTFWQDNRRDICLLFVFVREVVHTRASQGALVVKNSLGQEDPLEEGMATCSSILAWRIPWTEEPGRLQSTGSHTVGQD